MIYSGFMNNTQSRQERAHHGKQIPLRKRYAVRLPALKQVRKRSAINVIHDHVGRAVGPE